MKLSVLKMVVFMLVASFAVIYAQDKNMTGMVTKSGGGEDIIKSVVGNADLTSQVTKAMLENDASRSVFTEQLVSTLAGNEGIANEVLSAILKNPELMNMATKLMQGKAPSTDDAGGLMKGNK